MAVPRRATPRRTLQAGEIAGLSGSPLVDAPVVSVGSGPRIVFGSAFPNPTRDRTTMTFALPEAMEIRLEIYDLRGAHVRTLASARWPAGQHAIE